MAPIKVGDSFPDGVTFNWAPIVNDDPTICGVPQEYNASAFTPGCQARHLPPYIEKLGELKAKGVDIVAVIAYNDAWVMNAWGKVNKVKGDDILFFSDTGSLFSQQYGWMSGPRNARWAMAFDKDGKCIYSEQETAGGQITVSGVEAVLAKL